MARKILCESCNRSCEKAAIKYNEIWEKIKGTPVKECNCDDCGAPIEPAKGDHVCETCSQQVKGNPMGDICYAGVLIDNKTNPAYERQRPSKWASAYINEVFTCEGCNKETPTLVCIHCDRDHTKEAPKK